LKNKHLGQPPHFGKKKPTCQSYAEKVNEMQPNNSKQQGCLPNRSDIQRLDIVYLSSEVVKITAETKLQSSRKKGEGEGTTLITNDFEPDERGHASTSGDDLGKRKVARF